MRKSPRQERAQRTVGFVLDAAAYILAERGLEGFTTNHIAERAGVNIASLYQYFPNKAAILEALQARHMGKPDHVGPEAWAQARAAPLDETVAWLVDAALAEHAENPAMHRTLLTTVPRGQRAEGDAARLNQLADILQPKARAARNPAMMLFVARHALLGVIDEAICEHPEWLGDPDFRDELMRLVLRHLAPEPEAR